jgi:hypothetical protein
MSGFNILKNLNSYSGRNKFSVCLGTTRNIKASSNRIFNYCQLTTSDPFKCFLDLTKRVYSDVATFKNAIFNANLNLFSLQPSRVLQLDANNNVVTSNVTSTELSYLDATTNVQTLFNETPKLNNNATGPPSLNAPKIIAGTNFINDSNGVTFNFNPNIFTAPPTVIATAINTGNRAISIVVFNISNTNFTARAYQCNGPTPTTSPFSWIAFGI